MTPAERAVAIIGDWRLDKALEHVHGLHRFAQTEEDRAFIDRFHGWLLMVCDLVRPDGATLASPPQDFTPAGDLDGNWTHPERLAQSGPMKRDQTLGPPAVPTTGMGRGGPLASPPQEPQ